TRTDSKGRKQPSRKPATKRLTTQQQVNHAVRVQQLMDASENEKLQAENTELRSKLAKANDELKKTKRELAKTKAELVELIAAAVDDDVSSPVAGDTPDPLPLPPFPWRAPL